MAKTADDLTGHLFRASVGWLGIVAALVGVVTWISGWRYGHSLLTLGLFVVLAFAPDWRTFSRLGWAIGHVWLANKSIARSDLEEAEEHYATAARQLRRVAGHRRSELWRLATALDMRSRVLDHLGKHEDALPVAREAADAWRAAVAYATRTPQLAEALNRLAVTLGRLNREADAIPITEEAIAVNRQQVTLHEGHLARNLANLVISLSDGEHWERALPPAEEAWKIRRRLALTDPNLRDEAVDDADRLRRVLYRLDRPTEILRVSESLVDHERTLLADDPNRLPAYAEAVRLLGCSLVDVDRVPEAKTRWYEALELLRHFSETNPAARSTYASACEQVSHSLGPLGSTDETLAAIRTGLAVRRTLAAEDSQHHQELVRALASAALRLGYCDQPELAKQFAAEGLALYQENPETSGPPQVLEFLQEHAGEPPP